MKLQRSTVFWVAGIVCALLVLANILYSQNKMLAQKQRRWAQLVEEKRVLTQEWRAKTSALETETAEMQKKAMPKKIIPDEKLELFPYEPNERHAIVTMMGESAWWHPYWMGALAVATSLREVNTRVPNIIVLCRTPLSEVPKHALLAYEALGAKVIVIEDIKKADFISIPGVWSNAWSKLKIWQLEEYDKILFMDADTLVVNNLDHLLLEPELSAPWTPMACWCLEHQPFQKESEYYTLSSGFFVMKPNNTMYEFMMDLASKPSPDPWDRDQFAGSWHWGDQEMLRVVFKQLSDNWHVLPNTEYDTNVGLCYCPDRATTSRSYHFTCSYPVPKPWGDVYKSMFTYETACVRQIFLLWQRFLALGLNHASTKFSSML